MKLLIAFSFLVLNFSVYAQTESSDSAKLIFSPRPSNSIGYNPPSVQINGKKVKFFIASPKATRYVHEKILSDVNHLLSYEGKVTQTFVVKMKGQCMRGFSIATTIGNESYANEPKECEDGDFFILQSLSLPEDVEAQKINDSNRSDVKEVDDKHHDSDSHSQVSEI